MKKKRLSKVEILMKTRIRGRNEKCPCGSGKKYKKCCGKFAGEDIFVSKPSPMPGVDPSVKVHHFFLFWDGDLDFREAIVKNGEGKVLVFNSRAESLQYAHVRLKKELETKNIISAGMGDMKWINFKKEFEYVLVDETGKEL